MDFFFLIVTKQLPWYHPSVIIIMFNEDTYNYVYAVVKFENLIIYFYYVPNPILGNIISI